MLSTTRKPVDPSISAFGLGPVVGKSRLEVHKLGKSIEKRSEELMKTVNNATVTKYSAAIRADLQFPTLPVSLTSNGRLVQ